jgi:hypothetical protein
VLENITMSIASSLSFHGAATGSTPLTWSKTTGPSNVTVNSSSGLVEWQPLSLGTFLIGIKAENSTGSDIESFSAFIVPGSNTAPVITKPTDVTIRAGESYNAILVAVDPDGDVLSYELDPGFSPAGLEITPTTGLVSWLPAGSQNGTHGVVAIVSDGQNQSRSTWTITVSDTPWTREPPASSGPRFQRI